MKHNALKQLMIFRHFVFGLSLILTVTGTCGGAVSGGGAAPKGAAVSGGGAVSGEMIKGKASFYTEYASGVGSCELDFGSLNAAPINGMIGALHISKIRGNCGKCIKVESGGKSIIIVATDTCPACDVKKIDLSDKAFKELGSQSAGILDITWGFVDCPQGLLGGLKNATGHSGKPMSARP